MAALVKHLSKNSRLCYEVAKLSILKYPSTRYFSRTAFILSNRKYSDKHEWIVANGNIGTVGVSHYAQDALGDVVYVQVPEVGQKIEKDEEAGVIESVKAVNEVYTPVGGTVTEVNDKLTDEPSLINTSCYENGWMFKIEISDPKEVDSLMDEEAYEKYLKSIH
ncbi:glycine cleavage system H protein [Parasteatoda tepidariorum]|nr:glycine cleavage system H protein, mitochondrial [Parasteatoda tepidariorum]